MTAQLPLAGKTAFISGASGAIATASARCLLRDGAAVLLMDLRRAAVEETQAVLLRDMPQGRVEIHDGDARDPAAVQAALAQAHAMAGRLDIVVSTVGVGLFRPLLMHDIDSFRAELEVNLVTAFLAVRYGAPLMTRGGSIVCLSSTAATMPLPWMGAYGIAKGGVENLVYNAAEELGAAGIRVNYVRPGLTRSDATAGVFAVPAILDKFMAEIPLARTGEPRDIAQAIRYLAGPESSWVTGQGFAVDGGMELRKNASLPEVVEMTYGKAALDAVLRGKSP